MDLLFHDITLVSMDDVIGVCKHMYVGISDGKITYVSSCKPDDSLFGTHHPRIIDGRGKVLMPGLINAHAHIAMTALRGYADDYKLQTWLNDHIFPVEGKLDEECVYYGAKLGMMECLSFGVTAIADMYFHEPQVARAACDCGIRANVCNAVLYFSPRFDPEHDRTALELEALLREYKDHTLVKPDASIHAVYTSKSDGWAWAREMAEKHQLGLQIHIQETKTELDECLETFGKTPAEVFYEHGILNYPVNAAHCVWLTDHDMELFAKTGAVATHCPISNLKLASGVARVPEMLKRGVTVALGTDGVASNNNHDMFEEMKLGAILHKMTNSDASVMPAYESLKMATVGGAKALGRKNLGVIREGYDADVIMLDFDRPHLTPCYDVVSNLVYAAHGSDVVMTVVNGKVVFENGVFAAGDFRETADALSAHMSRIALENSFVRKLYF